MSKGTYKATIEDIKDYIEIEKKVSFNQFLRETKSLDKTVIADISGLELQGLDLKGANFSNTICSNVNFLTCNLEGAVFCDSNLQGSYFKHSKLLNVDFRGAELGNCKFDKDYESYQGREFAEYLAGMKFSFANFDAMKRYADIHSEYVKKYKQKQVEKLQHDRSNTEIKEEASYLNRLKGWFAGNKQKDEPEQNESQNTSSPLIEEGKEAAIFDESNVNRFAEYRVLDESINHILRRTDVEKNLDPTYIRGSGEEIRSVPKQEIEVNEEELEEFLKSNYLDLNAFMQSKRSKDIKPNHRLVISFKGLKLKNLDFSKKTLQHVNANDCTFKNCKFNNTIVSLSSFESSKFKSCEMNGAEFNASNLLYTQIQNDVKDCSFNHCYMPRVDLSDQQAEGLVITSCQAQNIAAINGIWKSSEIKGSSITEGVLNSARMENVKLQNVKAHNLHAESLEAMQTKFIQVDATGIKAPRSGFDRCVLDNFTIDNGDISGAQIKGVHATKLSAQCAKADNMHIEGGEINNSNLDSLMANNGKIKDCKLLDNNLENAKLSSLVNVKLEGENVINQDTVIIDVDKYTKNQKVQMKNTDGKTEELSLDKHMKQQFANHTFGPMLKALSKATNEERRKTLAELPDRLDKMSRLVKWSPWIILGIGVVVGVGVLLAGSVFGVAATGIAAGIVSYARHNPEKFAQQIVNTYQTFRGFFSKKKEPSILDQYLPDIVGRVAKEPKRSSEILDRASQVASLINDAVSKPMEHMNSLLHDVIEKQLTSDEMIKQRSERQNQIKENAKISNQKFDTNLQQEIQKQVSKLCKLELQDKNNQNLEKIKLVDKDKQVETAKGKHVAGLKEEKEASKNLGFGQGISV